MKMVKYKSGYSLVEMLIYVAILSVISLLSISTVLSFTGSYKELLALRLVEHSGIDAMEKMTRTIRAATSIDVANSTFGGSAGILTLVTVANSISTTTKFYLQNGIVKMNINGGYFGPITSSSTSITTLTFTKLDSPISNAVKIDMTVSAVVGVESRIKSYHSTTILKGL